MLYRIRDIRQTRLRGKFRIGLIGLFRDQDNHVATRDEIPKHLTLERYASDKLCRHHAAVNLVHHLAT